MKVWLSKMISSIASLIPTTNIVLFQSSPDYSDNAYAMCRYLNEKMTRGKWKFVWIIVDWERKDAVLSEMRRDGINAQLVKHQSIKGIWFFIRARYVFVSHGLYDAIKLHQHKDKVINLWHGMPLKKLGACDIDKPGGSKSCSTNFNYVISTSRFYQKIMAEVFATTVERVLVTGQPRCDLLFETTEWFSSKGINKGDYSRVGIWMPTFRKSIRGEVRVDGHYDEKAISFVNECDLDQLDVVLKETNTLLLIKIHPMDALQNTTFKPYSNIIVIKPRETSIPLYPLLGSCDFLLTDYSSVFIDYQILHKPIGFVMNDIEEYKNSRGLFIDDLEKNLPGPILSNLSMLIDFIRNPYVVNNNFDYNIFFDKYASERICKALKIEL